MGILPTLQIHPRSGGAAPSIQNGLLILQGERRWVLSGDAVQIGAAEEALGRLCERVENTLLISFGNTVGRIAIPGLGLVEVVSGKWGEQHFEHMLADLADEATALPFTVDQPTGFPYDRSVLTREDIPYHMFVYLRHILAPRTPQRDGLLPALQAIVQQPHERFDTTRRDIPLAAAQRIDQTSFLHIAAGVGGLARVESAAAARTPLARVLGGYLPHTVNERHTVHSVDTPENRFVKSFFRLATGIIEHMRRVILKAKTTADFRRRILNDCVQMDQVLAPFAHHVLWQSVGTMTQMPTSSTVLQGRRGYRDVYRHFVRLRLASQIPLDALTMHDLLESRDIAHLYEIWCYFAMVRALRQILGQPSRADRPTSTPLRVDVPHEFEVAWPGGVRLRYNPRFTRGAGAGHSYSVPLRPDIALHIGDSKPRMHLFDAKFRLEQLATLLPASDDELAEDVSAETVEERRGTFKRADIYKMHTYRDALPGTGWVWILYPGSESRFFTTVGTRLDPETVTLPGSSDGVGAIALRPESDGGTTIGIVLQQLLQAAGQ